tara:strand:+ start:169 stop:834 length:666 start_codon:yes stop_codon:yes gene_type:complete
MKNIGKSFTCILIACSTSSFFNASHASEKVKGLYGYGGLSYNRFTDFEGTVDSTKVDMQNSAAAGSTIGIGYDFGNTWKTDFSWYRTYGYYDKATVGAVSADLTGRFQLNSFLIGVSKDLIEQGTSPKFTPYVGVGIGMGKLYSEKGLTVTVAGVSGTSGEIKGDYGFLYSLKGGIDYAVSKNNDIYGEVKWVGYNSDVEGEVATDSGGVIGVEIGYKWKF